MADDTVLAPNQKIWLGSHLGKSLFVNKDGRPLMKVPSGINPEMLLGDVYLKQVRDLRAKLLAVDPKKQFGDEYETLKKQVEDLTAPLEMLGMPIDSLAEQAKNFEEMNAKRTEKLEEMRNLIAIQKEEFRTRTDVVYEVENEILPGTKKIPAKVVEGQFVGLKRAQSDSDEMVEMSKGHYEGRIRELDPATKKLLDLVILQLELITKDLLADKEIELSPNEVMAELWTPLVREGIISSDQCPEQYSRIMTLWKGASDLYLKRCESKAREPVDKTEGVQNLLEDLDQALDIGADIAGIVLTFVGGESAQEILKLVRKCVHGGLQGTKKALALEFDKAGNCIGDILEAVVEQATGNKDLSKIVKGAFTASLNGALMAKALANRQWDDAFGFMCSGLDGAFVVMDKGKDGKAGEIGNHVVAAMKGSKGIAKVAYLFSQDPVDAKAVMEEMGNITRDGVVYGVKTYVLDQKKENEKNEKEATVRKEMEGKDEKDINEAIEKAKEKIDEDYESKSEELEEVVKTSTNDEEGGGLLVGMADALGFKDKEIDEEAVMQDVLRRTEAKAMEDYQKKEETFERRIAIAFGVGSGADDEQMKMIEDLYDIDVLIGEIEEARAKIQLFKTIMDAVSGVLTMIVPQLGGPLKARNFAFDCASALRRSQELVKFQSLVGDARKSTSPQVHTLIAQVDELSHQLTNDVIEGIFHLTEACVTTAAGACELSGIAAPAGEALKIVEMGVEALHKSKDLIYKKFKDNKVKRGWNQFRKAIDNPSDRIAIMKAFRKNPTLAKYGIAYGALEMGDSIAKEALRQCGLNDMTLANENTNAEKVVRYLEVKFPDDIQVVGILSRFAPDSGDPLSMQIWVKNKELAVEAGWQKEDTNEIDVTLLRAKKVSDGIDSLKKTIGDATESELKAHWDVLCTTLEELSGSLRGYQPKTIEGQPFGRFVQYLNELADAAEQRSKELFQETTMRRKGIERETKGKAELKKNGLELVDWIEAVRLSLNDNMPTDDDTTGEIAAESLNKEFDSGQGKKLLDAIASCAKSSVLLQPSADFAIKAIKLGVMKATKDPVQVAGHINETVLRLNQCSSQIMSTLPPDEEPAKKVSA